MIILTTAKAVRHAITAYADHVPIQVLERYAALIDTEPIAWLYIIQPGDSAELLAQLRNQPFDCWEYIDRLDGWYEAVFVLSDDGFGHVILIPDQPDIDRDFVAVCESHAERPTAL